MRKNYKTNAMVKWLQEQITFANQIIEEAKECNNFGKETHYIGMRDAYKRCLRQLPD